MPTPSRFHDDIHKVRDRKRDCILRKNGWTVMRFHGTTIHHKAENCAYVVWREVKVRRDYLIELARREELRRQARRDAILRPFRWIARHLGRTTSLLVGALGIKET